jgi:hypothetical protein
MLCFRKVVSIQIFVDNSCMIGSVEFVQLLVSHLLLSVLHILNYLSCKKGHMVSFHFNFTIYLTSLLLFS